MEPGTITTIVQLVTLIAILSIAATATVLVKRRLTIENGRRYAALMTALEAEKNRDIPARHSSSCEAATWLRTQRQKILLETQPVTDCQTCLGHPTTTVQKSVEEQLQSIVTGYSPRRRALLQKVYQDTLINHRNAAQQLSSMNDFHEKFDQAHQQYLNAVEELRGNHDPHGIQQQLDAAHLPTELPEAAQHLDTTQKETP